MSAWSFCKQVPFLAFFCTWKDPNCGETHHMHPGSIVLQIHCVYSRHSTHPSCSKHHQPPSWVALCAILKGNSLPWTSNLQGSYPPEATGRMCGMPFRGARSGGHVSGTERAGRAGKGVPGALALPLAAAWGTTRWLALFWESSFHFFCSLCSNVCLRRRADVVVREGEAPAAVGEAERERSLGEVASCEAWAGATIGRFAGDSGWWVRVQLSVHGRPCLLFIFLGSIKFLLEICFAPVKLCIVQCRLFRLGPNFLDISCTITEMRDLGAERMCSQPIQFKHGHSFLSGSLNTLRICDNISFHGMRHQR